MYSIHNLSSLPDLKTKLTKYVKYGNIVNVVLFAKTSFGPYSLFAEVQIHHVTNKGCFFKTAK